MYQKTRKYQGLLKSKFSASNLLHVFKFWKIGTRRKFPCLKFKNPSLNLPRGSLLICLIIQVIVRRLIPLLPKVVAPTKLIVSKPTTFTTKSSSITNCCILVINSSFRPHEAQHL
eukprot:TRINITY_DN5764_c0_g2_i1.p1 TRINITY_DN5764_c0_g2~~TRINITY_DN5764_c0_g2_i1.p1  ORF type:complete len:115 (+),score=6.77 TRINITY_DN5764_c0_g2_i1:486-830(+)